MAASPMTQTQRKKEPVRLSGLPVFLYHGLTREEHRSREWKYLVSETEFTRQLGELRGGGYRTFLLREIWHGTQGSNNGSLPAVLTFDDGLASGYELAYPLLLEAGIQADFFINPSTIGQKGFLSWQQIHEMQTNGMSFQSHGYDHVDLSRLPLSELRRQLRDSKERLEDRIGAPVEFLAVPSGMVNRQVVELAIQEGYRAVCNSRSWPARPGSETVNRVPIFGRTTLRDFGRFLARRPLPYAARVARAAAVYFPKRLVLSLQPNNGGARISTAENSPKPNRLQVFVLIDALGWHYIRNRVFLDELLPYRKPLQTVLGYSSGAIPTILAGKPPAEHGHWNLFYLDPENSPFRWLRKFDFLPNRVLDNRIGRKLIKEMGRRVLGLGPLFECCVPPRVLPFFNWVEKRNIYQPGGLSKSSSIFDSLAEAGVPSQVYTYHQWTDKQILERAQRDIQSVKNGVFFLYLSEIDHLLHHHCEDESLIDQELASYEAALKAVFAAATEADPDARLTIFSDHGMTPVRHRYDLSRDIRTLGFVMPKDYLAVYDSTMARFWFYNPEARRQFLSYLKGVSCGRILADEELRQLGILFEDRRYGEVIFLLDPGWLMGGSDFNDGAWMPTGMHGYHPDDPYSSGIFLSNRPPQHPVAALGDVFKHMHEALE